MMQQHSAEWWAIRCGRVTASRIGDLMARNQPRKGQTVGDWSAKRNNYLAEKVAERITGKPRDRKRVRSLDERLDLEPDARAAYEFYNDCVVDLVGFVEHPRIPFAGASPDGLVGADGGIEIKCCDAEKHLEIVTAEAIDPAYLYQCYFNMACTEREWWDFTAFNPEMPEELKSWVKRIDRDEIMIASIEKEVIEFLAEVDLRVAQVRGMVENKTPLSVALESSLDSLGVH